MLFILYVNYRKISNSVDRERIRCIRKSRSYCRGGSEFNSNRCCFWWAEEEEQDCDSFQTCTTCSTSHDEDDEEEQPIDEVDRKMASSGHQTLAEPEMGLSSAEHDDDDGSVIKYKHLTCDCAAEDHHDMRHHYSKMLEGGVEEDHHKKMMQEVD